MEGVVRTDAGDVQGVHEDGLWVFRGIPFGADPGGPRRFADPEPPAPWQGVRRADAFGPIAPQTAPPPAMRIPGDPIEWSEDCLSLNVWTPGLDDRRRPVMVWVHGGGFTSGSGSSVLYRGDRLAARGDVVVVTINYRLGALGFLAHPELVAVAGADRSGCGNWGLKDQVLALRWVRDHIGEFGGDPANVTAFGESAGSMSLAALLAVPEAVGLFQRVILQSGPPATSSMGSATERAGRFAAALGLDTIGRQQLSDVEPERLVAAAQQVAAESTDGRLPLPFVPAVDGGLIDRMPAEAVALGAASSVPMLIGTTRDECAFFTLADPRASTLDRDRLVRRLSKIVGEGKGAPIVEAYEAVRAERRASVVPRDLWTAIASDLVFRVPSLALAGAQYDHQPSTFVYLFTQESPFLGGILGSCHAIDVPFVFGSAVDRAVARFTGSGPEVDALVTAVQRAWLSFARTGDPSCEEVGEWPGYDTARRPTMTLGPVCRVEDDPLAGERRAWDDFAEAMASRLHQH